MSLEKAGTIPIVEEQLSVSANAVLLVFETHDPRVVSPEHSMPRAIHVYFSSTTWVSKHAVTFEGGQAGLWGLQTVTSAVRIAVTLRDGFL